MRNEPHIPTIIGIAILLIGMLATIFLIENSPAVASLAFSQNSPQQVSVANISDNQFSVGWITAKPTISFIRYHEKGNLLNENVAYDVRDLSSKDVTRFTHLVTATNLKPNTAYTFSLINSNKIYSVVTFPELSTPNTILKPAFGRIENQEGTPADILLLGNFPRAQTVATVVNQDNVWVLPLNLVRTQSGSSYYNFKTKQILSMTFLNKNSQSQIKFFYDNASPLPLIRLGENYDFTNLTNRLLAPFVSRVYAKDIDNLDLPFTVIFPTPGAGIPTQKPIFKGTGTPNQSIIIVINGPVVLSQKIIISESGTWNWIPNVNLTPGRYSASFIYVRPDLKTPQTIGMNFLILKSGTSVLGDATPSASLKPTPSPTARPSPSSLATARPSPSSLATALPTPGISPSPVTSPNILKTGNTKFTNALIILGSLITIIGLVFFKKGHYYKIR